MDKKNAPLGIVIRGSLAEGIRMKLAEDRSVEDIRAGRFAVVDGRRYRFFSMITDVSLEAVNDQMLMYPPADEGSLERQVLEGVGVWGSVEIKPMLMLPLDGSTEFREEDLLPVKSIPSHFSQVYDADRDDISRVFGSEKQQGFFEIGVPLDMDDTPICLNLNRFIERSNGIFGKSGTGKTFLTRICLCGIIKQQKAVNLIFDMHSEYGWAGTVEGGLRKGVRGLKQFFNSQVEVFTLDPESSLARGANADQTVRIPYSQLTVEDIILLQRELNLTSTAPETAYMLVEQFGDRWIKSLLDMDSESIKDFCDQYGAHPGAISALKRKISTLISNCKGFLVESIPPQDDAVVLIMNRLQRGVHVVLEFGNFRKPVQYMLVANILTRRIHEAYVTQKEQAIGNRGPEPKPLVITIEEAHKFLSPALADQTIFGTIAREMRKYNVTLLIVDQRPSGIDDEVLSQVGTKLICLLDDERDMNAVLTGTPNAAGLRGVLASLDTRQQALILGHAVPMPAVIRTRTYDDEPFCLAMSDRETPKSIEELEKDIEQDFN